MLRHAIDRVFKRPSPKGNEAVEIGYWALQGRSVGRGPSGCTNIFPQGNAKAYEAIYTLASSLYSIETL